MVKEWIKWGKGELEEAPVSDAQVDNHLVREGQVFRRFPKGTVRQLDGVKLHVTRHQLYHASIGFIIGQRSAIEFTYADKRGVVRTVLLDLDQLESLWPETELEGVMDPGDLMTPEQAIVLLKELIGCSDLEIAHINADDVLCRLLRSLGHGDVVDEYHKINKWYA